MSYCSNLIKLQANEVHKLRRTKIVATMGPASESIEMIDKMIKAGVDVVRLNFSHGEPEDHIRRAKDVRERAALQGRTVGVLGDLQGPKIRTDRFVEGKVLLVADQEFVLDAQLGRDEGTKETVGITLKTLPDDVNTGDTLLLDDGRVVLQVTKIVDRKIYTTVIVGGFLSNNKGINRLGGGLTAPALTAKDLVDIKLAAKIDVDYLAVSFPQSADDVHETRRLLKEAGGSAGIVSKIERAEALECIDSIIDASDVIMIARGDLGVEIGDANLPKVQKELIHKARCMNKVVITATQMMESMCENPIPTRAEVFDVANAVLDGTDAVMLSGETAAGKYPAKAIAAMSEICLKSEEDGKAMRSDHRINTKFEFIDEGIAMATMYAANHIGATGIASLTESGSTALWMSRISSGIPIYAMSRSEHTRRRVTLYRGVYPVEFQSLDTSHAEVNAKAIALMSSTHLVNDGDIVIITKGDLMGALGGTNAMKIIRVGEKMPTKS